MADQKDIDQLKNIFSMNPTQKIDFENIARTIIAKSKNSQFCYKYFENFTKEQSCIVTSALHHYEIRNETSFDLTGHGFDYNLFNLNILRCVFFSFLGNNLSRIENLEQLILNLFFEDLKKYENDTKKFSFVKLCKEYSNSKLVSDIKATMEDSKWLKKINTLRNQITHSTINNILVSDAMTDDEKSYYVDENFTLSGNRENVSIFSNSLNQLIDNFQDMIINSLLTNGLDSLR